ncbi:MAG TPA: hypothetical protein VEZ70_11205 [Allosphingosinicella sp.]|nr:hypothetical protein [Allosphingosinicella sp.]
MIGKAPACGIALDLGPPDGERHGLREVFGPALAPELDFGEQDRLRRGRRLLPGQSNCDGGANARLFGVPPGKDTSLRQRDREILPIFHRFNLPCWPSVAVIASARERRITFRPGAAGWE